MFARIFIVGAIVSMFVFLSALPDATLIQSDYNRTEFKITIDNVEIYPVENGYFMIFCPGFGPRGKTYGPQLFGYSYYVAVPKNAFVSVSLEDVEWSDWQDILPAPRPPSWIKDFDIAPDDNLYSQVFGGSAEVIGDFIWRGVRVVAVDVVPVKYDPELGVKYLKSAKIVVNHFGGQGTIYDSRHYSHIFGKLYKAMLVNGDDAIPPDAFHSKEWNPDDGAELLIIARPDFTDEIQNWVDWKLWQGLPTKVATTDETGTSTTAIKNYIQNAYDTWALPPSYVLLVGDAEDISTYDDYGGNIGDHDYTTLDGGDDFSDVYIGRMSADNSTQITTIVQKHLNYEKQPDTTDDWYARAVGIINEDGEGHSISPAYCADPGPADSSYRYAVHYGMDSCCVPAGFTSVQVFTRCNGDDFYDVQPYVEAGLGFVQYRGQAWPDYYYEFGNSLSDAGGLDTLDNGGKCPINISITCGTADFQNLYHSDAQVMCERSTRARTATHPKGSVQFIGQTAVSSNSVERSSLSRNIFKGLFKEKINQVGAAHCYGKNQLWAEFGGSPDAREEFGRSALLGSPEMLAWTAPIQAPVVEHLVAVPPGPNDISVVVSAGGARVENARVAIHQDDVFSYNLTDAAGSTVVSMDIDASIPVVIVVTGPNIYPYQDTIDVNVGGVAIYCAQTTFNDISGDGDGLINPGETISFTPIITNIGDEAAGAGLNGVLRINDPDIIIIDSTTTFPAIAPGDTVSGDTMAFLVLENHQASEGLNFTLHITGHPDGPWDRNVIPNPPVHRYSASIDTVLIDDSSPLGNGDGKLDPGEQAFLTIRLGNQTQADVFDLSGELVGSEDSAAVVQQYAEYGNLLRLTTKDNYPEFSISVSPFLNPGDEFTLPLILTGDCPMYVDVETLYVQLSTGGDRYSIPTGPDAYGYYIIDDTDVGSGLAPIYEWNDITSSGTTIGDITNSDDAITDIALPFPMKFYGNVYNSISVASNGFIAPPGCTWSGAGSGTPQTFPNSSGPEGIVAPMWADLAPHRSSGGDIFRYYDASAHKFYIQYDNVQFYYGYGYITFQIVICDTQYYHTPTGDSEIYFYYNYVNITDNGGVGIESPDETTGLQYYYEGVLDETAAPIEVNRALRITTIEPGAANQPWLYYLDSLSYDDSNGDNDGIIEPNDMVHMYFRLKNGGTQGAFLTTGSALSTSMISTTGENGNFSYIAPGVARSNAGYPIGFQISSSCPPDTIIVIPVAISANSGGFSDTLAFLLKVGMIVDVDEGKDDKILPDRFDFLRVHPNPFNDRTVLEIDNIEVDEKTDLKISLFTMDGRCAKVVYDGKIPSGKRQFIIDGDGLSSGIYVVRVRLGEKTTSGKILLIK
ncbi:T9SS type A sorting domain-containing protein [bacterium]|nr:T9SS type A sorting domain-containing protein [bacterium]